MTAQTLTITKAEYASQIRERLSRFGEFFGEVATHEVLDQAGLPPVFLWHNLTVRQLQALGVAMRIRELDAC